ncbi:FixG Ig-like domain-containing protein, partial [Levilinea saccharolytica]
MNVRTQLWKLSIFASILALLLTGTLRAPAQAAPLAAPGVTLAVDKTARTNLPGSLLTYTLTLTNTGDAADTFSLTLSSTEWGAGLSQSSLSLEAGAAGNATASVTIPENAVDGASQSFKVTAVSGLDGSVSASVNVTGSARIP